MKDDFGSFAVFTEQGSSASQMTREITRKLRETATSKLLEPHTEGIPEWLEDFTENLEIEEMPAAAKIPHDSGPERHLESGIKQAQYLYSLPI